MATIGLPAPARRPEFEVNVRCGTGIVTSDPSHSQITHNTAIANLKSDHSCDLMGRAVPGRPGAPGPGPGDSGARRPGGDSRDRDSEDSELVYHPSESRSMYKLNNRLERIIS